MSASEAQKEAPMNAEPQKEHRWLQRLVGDWTVEAEASMGPDKPLETCAGTENVRSLGGLWIVAEGQSEMPGGGPMTSLMIVGYDPQKKRFAGTFIASVMTNLWVYDGELDHAEKILTLNAEGPDFAQPDKTVKYKDVIEFKSEDHRRLTSHMLGDDGQWHQFMKANYYRKK
jgi:Protein of unknown function (DUF1579)